MNRIAAALLAVGALAAGLPALAAPTTGPPPAFSPASPTPAPPPERLPAPLRAELANVQSFRTSVAGLPGIMTVTTVVLPDRIDTMTVIGPLRSETLEIGADRYSRVGGAAWTHATVDAAMLRANVASFLHPFDTGRVTMLPDRVVDGRTYGYFRTDAMLVAPAAASGASPEPAPETATTTCRYSKQTYLPQECDVTFAGRPSDLRITYGKWNAAGNVIEAPTDIASPAP